LPVVEALQLARPYATLVGEYLGGQWRENLGVESRWTYLDYERLTEALVQGSAHVGPLRWIADYPDPDNFLRVAMGHYSRHAEWHVEDFESLMEQARQTADPRARLSLFQEADRRLIEAAVIAPLVYGRSHLLIKPWVRNYKVSPMGTWFWKDVIIEPH